MNIPVHLKTTVEPQKPILIVDKKGVIGSRLAKNLAGDFLVVLASHVIPEGFENFSNIVHVGFKKKIPQIPDNIYSAIFIIQDEESFLQESLSTFVLKAKRDNAPLYYLSWIGNNQEKLIEIVVDKGKDSKVFLYGDLFAADVLINPHTPIGKFLNQAKDNQLKIENDGLGLSFPVFIDDLVNAVIKVCFYENKNSQVFYAFQDTPVTDLSLGRLFQKIDPDIRIDFVKTQKDRIVPRVPAGGEFILDTKLEAGLSNALGNKDNPKPVTYLTKTQETRYLKSYFLWIFILFIFFLLLPLITTLLYGFLGRQELLSAKKEVEQFNLPQAEKSIKNASSFFDIAQKTNVYLAKEAMLVGQGNRAQALDAQLFLGKTIADGSLNLLTAVDTLYKIGQGVSKNPDADFQIAQNNLKTAISSFREVQALASSNKDVESKLIEIRPVLDLASSSIDLPSKLLGFDQDRKYLILFQNNMELRPTGGFIGSYGLLTISKGRVKDFSIQDVYDADGQLKAHVEPPFPIRRFMQIPHLYLRDSNFDISFAQSAPVSANLLNLETNEKVDGVWAVDLNFAKNILSVTGPIQIPDYKVTLTSENFFEETQKNVESHFFPGSTQKKDFLRSVFNSLSQSLQSKKISYLALTKVLMSSLSQKDIILASSDPTTQEIFSTNGWANDLRDDRNKGSNLLNDYLQINEANIGVSKVNYYVTRSVSQTVEIKDDGSVVENSTLSFKNTSPKKTKLNYSNYLRIAVPLNSSITNINIDGIEQNIVPAQTDPLKYELKSFKPPTGLELESYNENGKKVFGFLLNINPESVKNISISYVLADKVNVSGTSIGYSLKINKQPGIENYPFDFTFIFPKNFHVLSYPTNFMSDEKVSYIGKIAKDEEFNIKLGQK